MIIRIANGEVVACNTTYYPTELKEKHAAHIVKCVNMHDELVEALEWCVEFIREHVPNEANHLSPMHISTEALAKARGEV